MRLGVPIGRGRGSLRSQTTRLRVGRGGRVSPGKRRDTRCSQTTRLNFGGRTCFSVPLGHGGGFRHKTIRLRPGSGRSLSRCRCRT